MYGGRGIKSGDFTAKGGQNEGLPQQNFQDRFLVLFIYKFYLFNFMMPLKYSNYRKPTLEDESDSSYESEIS